MCACSGVRVYSSPIPAAPSLLCSEDIIFQEGYRRGQADALARIDAEAEVRTRGVFGKLQAEASEALAKDVTARAQALRERGTRGPMKAVECAAEEAALLACNPAKDAGKCVDVQSAYMQCGDGELRRAMHPVLR